MPTKKKKPDEEPVSEPVAPEPAPPTLTAEPTPAPAPTTPEPTPEPEPALEPVVEPEISAIPMRLRPVTIQWTSSTGESATYVRPASEVEAVVKKLLQQDYAQLTITKQ